MPSDYAIVIGIDHYPKYQSLSGAINDAKTFYKWLKEYLKVKDENNYLILSEQTDDVPKPVKDEIDYRFVQIIEKASQDLGGRLFIYFSGHGLGVNIDDTALCLSGWWKRSNRNALSSRSYKNEIIQSNIFSSVYMFMDCCRDNSTNGYGLESNFDYPELSNRPLTEYFIASAAEYGKLAYEGSADEDGLPSKEELENQRGYFTMALMEGLKSVESEKELTARNLRDFIELKTTEFAKKAGKEQIGEVDFRMPSNPVIIKNIEAPKLIECTIIFENGGDDIVVLEDWTLKEVKKGPTNSGPWKLKLLPKNYIIRKENEEDGIFFSLNTIEGSKTIKFQNV